MTGIRELAAIVLGVAVGSFLLAFPNAVIRLYTAGRVSGGRRGEYGADGEWPRGYQLLVRGVGAVTVLIGLAIGATTLGVL